MPLTKESLAKRLTELEEDRDKALAQLNGIVGAIQITNEYLADCDVIPTPVPPLLTPSV